MSNSILQYIPQRAPFVMVDTLLLADDTNTITSFTVPENNPMVEDGYFTASGLVENMAQSAAAGTGYKAHQSGQPTPIGFIGALKNLTIKRLPKVNDILTTTIHFGMQVMNAQIIQASISENGTEIAICELKIFLQQ